MTTRYATPAERERGCVWSERFESQTDVEDNGGAVTGSPSFSGRDGVTLDGSNDYLTYHLAGREFYSDPLSIVIEFTPDFADDDGVSHVMLDTSNVNGGRCIVYKDSSNRIVIYLGNTSIATISNATFTAYWNTGSRNVLVVSGTTGETDAFLNGTQILTNDITAWTPASEATCYVGALNDGSAKFDGTIHRVQIYHSKLSDLECEQISGGTVYGYENQGTIWPLTASSLLADTTGANDLTSGTPPAKITDRHGYYYDGSTHAKNTSIDTGIFNQAEVTLVLEFNPTYGWDDATVEYWVFAGSTGSTLRTAALKNSTNDLRIYAGDGSSVKNIAKANVEPHWRTGQRNVLVLSLKSGDNDFYLNGALIDTSTGTWTAQSDVVELGLGCRSNGGNRVTGDIYSFSVLNFKASYLQALDITQRLMKQANRV